jgi:hypothetical protein
MFPPFRYAAIAFSLVSLAGCAQAPAPAVPRPPSFSLDTPVDRIAADQRGKAVLDRDLPGLMASRSYALFDDMSLSQIATVSGGKLTQSKLDRVQADLSQLSDPPPRSAIALQEDPQPLPEGLTTK